MGETASSQQGLSIRFKALWLPGSTLMLVLPGTMGEEALL